jgi:hypothetical protein
MLKLLERLGGGRVSDKVGRNALEQFRFKLARDLRDMEKIEQQHPDLLAPNLFFAWHRHHKLKQACQGYAAEIARLTGSTAKTILVDTLAGMQADRQADLSAEALYRRWFADEDHPDSDQPIL